MEAMYHAKWCITFFILKGGVPFSYGKSRNSASNSII